jgi:hypothetical protein
MSNYIQLIAVVSGLVGTIGGVLISYLSLKHNYDRDKQRIKVEFGKNRMINVPGVDPDKDQFTIMAANIGNIPFTVAMLSINIGRRTGGLVMPDPLGTHKVPVTLERNQTCNFWTDYQDSLKSIHKITKRNKIRIRALVRDYTGSAFYSDWMAIRFKETNFSKIEAILKNGLRKALLLVRP